MRQHVNPLSNVFFDIEPLPPLKEIFNDFTKPLHLDIGCGSGDIALQISKEVNTITVCDHKNLIERIKKIKSLL